MLKQAEKCLDGFKIDLIVWKHISVGDVETFKTGLK